MKQSTLWIYEFGLEAEDSREISRQLADDLMNLITEWAETHGLLVGGGYREPIDSEKIPIGPNYPASLLLPLRPEDDT